MIRTPPKRRFRDRDLRAHGLHGRSILRMAWQLLRGWIGRATAGAPYARRHTVTGEESLLSGLGRIRDIKPGPDGFIYLAVDGRGGVTTPIVRLEPVGRG